MTLETHLKGSLSLIFNQGNCQCVNANPVSGRSNTWYEIAMKHLHGIESHGMKINDLIKLIC